MNVASRFRVFFTSCLAVSIVVSCDNTTNRTEQKAQINLEGIAVMYKYKCAICHGENGVSVIKGAPNLVTTEYTMEERVDIIMNGKGTMPPQKDVLDMPTIRGLAVYIDRLK